MSESIIPEDESDVTHYSARHDSTPSGLFRLHTNASRGSLFASQSSESISELVAGGRNSPRVFNIVLSPRSEEDVATDAPYHQTNYVSLASGYKLPSSSFTEDSSARTGPYAIDAVDDSTVFEMPLLRRNPDHTANSRHPNATVATARLYAGTSSGLTISVRWILAGVAVGLALGILLGYLKVSRVTAQWVSLPGDLFLRALKCLVVPYVFCSIAVAVGDIVFVGKVSVVGLQTAKVFAITWVTSVALGVGVALLFRPLFRLDNGYQPLPQNHLDLLCAGNQPLRVEVNGSVLCDNNSPDTPTASFIVNDLHQAFVPTNVVVTALSLTDELLLTITPLVSSNIFASFASGQLISITTFAMALGAIAGRQYFLKTRETNYLYLVLLQLRNTIFLLMEWTIWLSAFAVVSIIAGSFATNQQAMHQFHVAYAYVLATVVATILHLCVLLPLIVYALTRCNLFKVMRQMIRAYIFAFACSSSLATAPVTLTCVRKAEICSPSLANFVVSIGISSNVSGIGFYMPIACIFIAESSGNGNQITVLRIVGLFALSVLSCAGTPPIPAAGLVVVTTIYTTIFGVATMPATFAYVIAMDFVVDRLVTLCDVNDDIMALKVVAETTDETVTQEVLGERDE